MQAIELEATVEQHSIRVPETIQDGTHLRVLLLMDDPPANAFRTDDDLKRRLEPFPLNLFLLIAARRLDLHCYA